MGTNSILGKRCYDPTPLPIAQSKLRSCHSLPGIVPFLRWVGGKQQITSRLLSRLPPDIHTRRYIEPFVGAGSLFFAVAPFRAILADANEHLIECYRYVRRFPKEVSEHLERHRRRTARDYYYKIRDTYNSATYSAAQAARFIYLNKTCFNGIFRVNRHGEFNVPYGWKEPPALPSQAQLLRAANGLRTATLLAESFEQSLSRAGPGDFIYLDPPYPALSSTAYFTHYTTNRFAEEDHLRLAALASRLHRRGCLFLMTNADTAQIRELYRGYSIEGLSVTRYVTCKRIKHKVSELVIRNY